MACVFRNERKDRCTEPILIRRRLTKLLCGETGETDRQKRTSTRIGDFEQIDNNFDLLFANRGDTTNIGNCTYTRNPKCSSCTVSRVKPRKLS